MSTFDSISDMRWAEAKAEASLLGISTTDYLWGRLEGKYKTRRERMATLMELTDDYKLLLDRMQDADYEEMQVFEDTLECVLAEVGDKADAYAVVIEEAKSTVEKLKRESIRLSAWAERIENNISRMKDRLKSAMEQMQVKTLEGDFHKFRIQKNGGKVPMEITGDVPDSYKRIIYEPDKEKIRKDLESGIKLSFAHLGECGTHLRID